LQKVILKTALKTLLGIFIALILAFTVASLGFPRSMAKMFENWEWYAFSTGYYSLAYSYRGDIDDLAKCAENSILDENDSKIIKYCEKLLAHEDFEGLCERKKNMFGEGLTFDYKKFITENLAQAKQRKGIAGSGAFATAFENALLNV